MTDKTPDPCGSDSSTELGVLPAPVATIANDGHPRHIGYVWGVGEARLYGPPRNLYREDQVKAYAAAAVAAERERWQEVVFDGWRVLQGLDEHARKRTSHQNVNDVLDALVRVMKPNTKLGHP